MIRMRRRRAPLRQPPKDDPLDALKVARDAAAEGDRNGSFRVELVEDLDHLIVFDPDIDQLLLHLREYWFGSIGGNGHRRDRHQGTKEQREGKCSHDHSFQMLPSAGGQN
jgi:hypothetical protein